MARMAKLHKQTVALLAHHVEDLGKVSPEALIVLTNDLLVLSEQLEARADEVKSEAYAQELQGCCTAYDDVTDRLLRLLGLKVVTYEGERQIVEEGWRK